MTVRESLTPSVDRIEASSLVHIRTKSSLMRSLKGGLGWRGGAALLATYCASSSTVIYPTTFGRLGYVFSTIALAAWILVAVSVQLLLAEFNAQHPEVKSAQDFGFALGGWLGRTVMAQCFIWNQQLFLPVTISFSASSLKNMVQGTSGTLISCNVVWILMILLLFVVGVNVFRDFGHTSWIAVVTCATTTLQVVCIIVGLLQSSSWSGPSYAWPPAELTDTGGRGQWNEVFAAFTNFGYGYCPCFVVTEIMAEMDDRTEIRKSLISASLFMYALYAVSGVILSANVGWKLNDPVTGMMAHDVFGIIANFTLFFASVVDHLITSITVNQWLLSRYFPAFELDDWSASGCIKWFFITMPSQTVAIGMVLLVPDLGTLVGILVAVVLPLAQAIVPALLILNGERKGVFPRRLTICERALLVVTCCFGAVLMITGVSSTVMSLSQLKFEGNYFCDVVGA